jgi:NhaP-type Na+/H+ or K+/H+ antiporter
VVETLALIAVVIAIAALFSGLMERVRAPEVALFLLVGLVLGPHGLGLVHYPLASPVLATIATVGLIFVLFTDAVSVDAGAARQQRRLAMLVLGPGTLVTALVIAIAGWLLLDLAAPAAAILGAALASTDPVLMRSLTRRPGVPDAARQTLGLESGLNDAVLLPVVLVAMLFLEGLPGHRQAPARLAIDLMLLGPGAGVAVGFIGVTVLERVRRQVGVRRDYESLYAIGLALAAYAAAEALHGSGFLAVFAAGLTIAATDAELCDCFLDFGQAGAEIFLLFTFVALGASVIWTGFDVVSWQLLVFALVALFGRSLVLASGLRRHALDPVSRRLIVWYGPRGLSSLLLVLLPVFAGWPGGGTLFAYAALVVLLSIVIHGGALMLWRGGQGPPAGGDAEVGDERFVTMSHKARVKTPERITITEVHEHQKAGAKVHFLDVRKARDWRRSQSVIDGAIRMPPDDAVQRAAELALPKHDWLVAYCA